jgi:hypothetical protein
MHAMVARGHKPFFNALLFAHIFVFPFIGPVEAFYANMTTGPNSLCPCV